VLCSVKAEVFVRMACLRVAFTPSGAVSSEKFLIRRRNCTSVRRARSGTSFATLPRCHVVQRSAEEPRSHALCTVLERKRASLPFNPKVWTQGSASGTESPLASLCGGGYGGNSGHSGGGGGSDGGRGRNERPDGNDENGPLSLLTQLGALLFCIWRRLGDTNPECLRASLFGTVLLATQFNENPHTRRHVAGSVVDAAAFVGDSQRPVVILLSWLGAQQRHMVKYAEWYRDRGYDVITLFNGLQTALIPAFSRRQALRVLHLMDEIPENRPIVVHSFSIGTGIYGYMLDIIQRGQYVTEDMGRKLQRQIRGVIFDSGPGHMQASSLAQGLYAACPKVGYRVWNAVAEALFRFLNVAEGFRAAEHALQNVQLPSVPQLYLYSLDDSIVKDLDKSVREYIDAQRRRGLEVYQKVWEQSQHATHFKVHPEEYKAQVESFLKRALSDVEVGMRGMLDKLHEATGDSESKANPTSITAAPAAAQ
jgi:hypothetical protein